MKTVIGKITEELGELGKKIITETASVPVDIVMPKKSEKQEPPKEPEKRDERPVAPRQMLEQFAQKKKPVPSVYERKQMEETEKKEKTNQQAAATAWQQLPNTGHAAKRGDLRNIAKKQANPEAGKNIVNQ